MTLPRFINPEIGLTKPTRVLFGFIDVDEFLPDLKNSRYFIKYISPLNRKDQLKWDLKKEKVFLEHFLDSIKILDTESFLVLDKCIDKLMEFNTFLKVQGTGVYVTKSTNKFAIKKNMVICDRPDSMELLKDLLKKQNIKTYEIYHGLHWSTIKKRIRKHKEEDSAVLIAHSDAVDPNLDFGHVDQLIFLTTSNDVVVNTQAILRCYSTSTKEDLSVKIVRLWKNDLDARYHSTLMRHIISFFRQLQVNTNRTGGARNVLDLRREDHP